MFLRNLAKSFLLVMSVACAASAYLLPANTASSNQYQPGLGVVHAGGAIAIGSGNDEGWVDPGSGVVDPSPYDPVQPGQPGYANHDVKSAWINRTVTNERLPLRELTGLDSFYQGWEVVSVRANTRPNNPGRTVVQLVADGRIIATQVNPGYQINLTPQIRAILGRNIRTLQLVVSGSTYIDDIQVEVLNSNGNPPQPPYPNPQPPPYPQPQPPPPYMPPGNGQQRLDIDIYRNLVGNDRVDITQYIDISRYRGLAIEQVIISGRPQFNTSLLSVIINGNNMGQVQFSGAYSQNQSVWLNRRPVIGNGADSIVLYSSGNMTVERVTLVLSY